VHAALVLGKAIAAKPSKIIAGHDADKTNELLQALADAINKKVSKMSSLKSPLFLHALFCAFASFNKCFLAYWLLTQFMFV